MIVLIVIRNHLIISRSFQKINSSNPFFLKIRWNWQLQPRSKQGDSLQECLLKGQSKKHPIKKYPGNRFYKSEQVPCLRLEVCKAYGCKNSSNSHRNNHESDQRKQLGSENGKRSLKSKRRHQKAADCSTPESNGKFRIVFRILTFMRTVKRLPA